MIKVNIEKAVQVILDKITNDSKADECLNLSQAVLNLVNSTDRTK
jgi:hypothetical protein